MNEQKNRTQDRLVWLGDVKDGILKWWEENEHPYQDPWLTVLAVINAVTATTPTADAVPMDYHERCMELAEEVRIQQTKALGLAKEAYRQLRDNYVIVARCKDCVSMSRIPVT